MNTVQTPVKVGLAAAEHNAAAPSAERGRLIVIVPDVAEPALLAARIRLVAETRGQDVVMLGVASKSVSENDLRRRLTFLAAFLQGADVNVQFRVEEGQDWMPALLALLRANDLLACCVAEGSPGRGAEWLDQLSSQSDRPVYAFMDGNGVSQRGPGLLAGLAPWLASLGIIVGFFWLQVWLSQQGEGGAYSGWLLATVIVEIGLVWLVNVLLG